MADCHPTDYVCRIAQTAGGVLQGATGLRPSDQAASEWWKIIIGVIVLAILVDYSPRLGGWMLLLIVAGLALSPRARSIIAP